MAKKGYLPTKQFVIFRVLREFFDVQFNLTLHEFNLISCKITFVTSRGQIPKSLGPNSANDIASQKYQNVTMCLLEITYTLLHLKNKIMRSLARLVLENLYLHSFSFFFQKLWENWNLIWSHSVLRIFANAGEPQKYTCILFPWFCALNCLNNWNVSNKSIKIPQVANRITIRFCLNKLLSNLETRNYRPESNPLA